MIERQEPNPKIACLAWGSLVWNPRQLPVAGEWFKDGPLAPIEFTRQSDNGRITLVIDQIREPVPVLWTYMSSSNLGEAQKALRDREGISAANWLTLIGSWKRGQRPPRGIPELPEWAEARALDAIVWTALAPRFGGRNISPSADEVIAYLRGLSGHTLVCAKEYIERAPRQINTDYRRQIEAALGWLCRADL